jgi:O-antigen/teichoic acid export membrane protein
MVGGIRPAGEHQSSVTVETSADSGPALVAGATAALIGQLAVYGLGFVTSIILARELGPTGRGELQLAVMAATVTLMVANLSIESSNTIAKARGLMDLRHLSRLSAGFAVTLGPAAILTLVGVYAATRHSLFLGLSVQTLLLAAASIPVALHLLWMSSLFVLAGRLPQVQLAVVLGAAVQLLGAVALAASGRLTVDAAVLLYDVSILVPWIMQVVWVRSFGSARPQFERGATRLLLGISARLHPGLVFYYLLMRSDVFVVNVVLGARAVGVYSIAVLFGELSWMITDPLARAILPAQAAESESNAMRVSMKAGRLNASLATALSAVLAATLWLLIPALYGHSFAASYGATVALLPGIVAVALARPLIIVLVRVGKPLRYSLLAGAAFALNLALNLALLSPLGIIGASLASSVAYIALAFSLVRWAAQVAALPFRAAVLPNAEDLATVRRLPGVLRRRLRARHGASSAPPA